MKADKTFYDTLREEVKQGTLRTSHHYMVWGRKIMSVEESSATSQASEGEKQKIQELNGKIEGLESQIELLKEANRKLTEKNRELEARLKMMSPVQEFVSPELPSVEKPITLMEGFEKKQGAKFQGGYIPILEIVRFANEIVDEDKIHLIQLMIYDTCPVLTEEARKLVRNIGSQSLNRNGPLNVEGDLILNQENITKVDNVNSGAIGIMYNK